MTKSDTHIIVIDNDFQEDDPLIVKLRQSYNNVHLFGNPEDGIGYIESNLNQKNIVLLDILFPSNEPDGHEILRKIRDISYLIPVIIWSGLVESNETFSDFINLKTFKFIKKNTPFTDIISAIKEAELELETSLEGALEEWIELHGQRDEPILVTSSGKEYSLNDILKEVRMQTEFGAGFEKRLLKLTIDLLMRGKEKVDD